MKMWKLKRWVTQQALDLIVWLHRDCSYQKHLHGEVPTWFTEDGPNRWMADGTAELLAVFSHHGHSGSSAPFAAKFFEAMAMFKPWGPLTGEEHEWGEPYDNDGSQQNKRCGHVFRDRDGRAYDIDGKIFREPSGACYTNSESRVYIEFPYTPTREYVDVPERA